MEEKKNNGEERQSSRRKSGREYNGVRMRNWGKWVAEIRQPKKRSRIWLGTYKTAIAAARAHDMAMFYLRGRSDRLNFPEYFVGQVSVELSADEIRRMAIAVGSEVDAVELGTRSEIKEDESAEASSCCGGEGRDGGVAEPGRPDLNKSPDLDGSDCDVSGEEHC